jgi:putative DNA primase/helicase
MTALDRLRDALTAHNCNPRGTAARCPAHDDRAASLSVGAAKQFAGVLVKCHAGCSIDDILAELGLNRSDLFDEPRQANQGSAVVAEYPYTDAAGKALYVKQRLWPKAFRQYVRWLAVARNGP